MPSESVVKFLSRLGNVKKNGGGWMAICPCHGDKTPSLSVSEGADGKCILFCHAGCSTYAILEALNVRPPELFEKPLAKAEAPTYDYRDADGVLRMQVVRFEGKEFRQRQPNGSGGYIWNVKGVKRLPYRLPELQGQATVVIAEGEKDVDKLWAIGIPATTNCGGAGKWGAAETKALKLAGATRIIILPDNDAPGQKHAEIVATRAKKADIAVSVVNLPGLPPHGDVSDWLQGHDADDLRALMAVPYVVPKAAGAAPEPVIAVPDVPAGPDWHRGRDYGAAEAFCARYGDIVRYDFQSKEWVIWQNHHWQPDADSLVRRLAHTHIREWQAEAVKIPDAQRRNEILAFTMKLNDKCALDNCLVEARSLADIKTDGAQWDLHPWLLTAKNGVVDLRTGVLEPGRPTDMLTLQTRCAYEPDAPCVRWERFLGEVFEGDEELISYLHRAVGYSLTGDMREQCFFLLVGPGANGKSVFLDTIEYVLGTFSHRSPMRVFISGADDEKFHMADFRGRRFIAATETKPGGRLNEHVLKHITGGETLRVERKFGHPFTISPECKIWLGVNHYPTVMDDSFGFWRRVRIIPFQRIFAGTSEDRGLRNILRAESTGILAWAIAGCRLWQEKGLNPPLGIMNAVESYQVSEDPLSEFLTSCTIVESDSYTTSVKLYNAYTDWAKQHGLKGREVLSSRSVGLNMSRRPFERKVVYGSTRYVGFRLIDQGDLLSRSET